MDVSGRHFRLFLVYCALMLSFRVDALELNGVAPFSELGEEIYLAAVHVGSRTTDPGSLFSDLRERKLEIRFSSTMSRRRWATNWMQSIAINNNREHLEAAAGELSDVLGVFRGSLFRGDRVEIHYVPGAGTEVRVNDQVLATGHSAEVFNLFLSSWIGPVPPSSQFRNQLLGLEDSSERTRFMTLQPALDRIETVAAWVADAEPSTQESVADETPATETAVAAAEEPSAEREPSVGSELSADSESAAESGPPTGEEQAGREIAAFSTPEPTPAVGAPDPADTASATTMPEPDAVPETAVAAATDPGRGAQLDDDDEQLDLSVEAILGQQDYMAQLIRDVYTNIRYPERAVRRNFEGSVRMRLIVSRDGSLSEMQIMEGARHEVLNSEAERAVLAAAPFSPVPDELSGDQLEVELPINFRLE